MQSIHLGYNLRTQIERTSRQSLI